MAANLAQARRMEDIGFKYYGYSHVNEELGPFPLDDTFGMKAATVFLRRSIDPGRNERYIQFSTARKIRSAFSNIYHASKKVGQIAAMAFQSTKTYATTCPTYGYWFERFVLGCHKRMGDFTVSDFALAKDILVCLIEDLEEDYAAAEGDVSLQDEIVEIANVIIIGYLNGLRGEEIVKIDANGLLKYLDAGARHPNHPHVIVPLVGRLKGETGERYHMLPMSRVTSSGIEAGKWADRLGIMLVRLQRTRGFVFVDEKGNQAKIAKYDPEFVERLERVQARCPDLFEPGIKIADAFGLRRSLRRGSTSEAVNAGVSPAVIDLNNRWRKFERAKGMRPGMSMNAHYTEVRLVLAKLIAYSHSL